MRSSQPLSPRLPRTGIRIAESRRLTPSPSSDQDCSSTAFKVLGRLFNDVRLTFSFERQSRDVLGFSQVGCIKLDKGGKAMNEPRPKVAIIATGGTIASAGEHSLDIIEYDKDIYTAERLLEEIPEARRVADLLVVSHVTIGSDAIGPNDWLTLHRKIEATAREHPDVGGFVVTHGTATLEETAYFLNLTLKIDRPVVVVGAQRPITGLSTDGPMNLVGAIRLAGCEAARGLGVLVVLNDEIHAAREVTKGSVFRLDAFRTPDFGVLGHTDLDEIRIYRQPTRRHTVASEFDLSEIETLPQVGVVASYAGADGVAVEAFVASGAKGLVISSLAPGMVPPAQTCALRKAVEQGVVVAYSCRAGAGRVLKFYIYQVEGSIVTDNLNPQKARVLLMLALTRTTQAEEIQRMFNEY